MYNFRTFFIVKHYLVYFYNAKFKKLHKLKKHIMYVHILCSDDDDKKDDNDDKMISMVHSIHN